MGIEGRVIHEPLQYSPHERIICRLNVELEATGLSAGEFDVSGKVPTDDFCLVVVGADKASS